MRGLAVLLVAVVGLVVRMTVDGNGGAWSLLWGALGVACMLTVMGQGLLRILRFSGEPHALWPASLVVGLAVGIVLSSAPLVFGLGQPAQGMALMVGLMGLSVAAILGTRQASEGFLPTTTLPPPLDAWCAVTPALGVLVAWLPLLIGDAWSVAGHDLDTLQHQDGALHAIMTILCGEGQKTAPGYPLGLHAFMSALGGVWGLTAFQTLCLVLVLLPGVLTAAVIWAASVVGVGPLASALCGLMAALHPLLLFTSMEQFAPQLAAAALIPGVLAACAPPFRSDDARADAVLPSVLLAALVAAYGLSLAVAGPVAAAALLVRTPWARALKCTAWVVLFTACLSPLGIYRLADRLHGGSEAGQSPVKAAQRVKDAPPLPSHVLAPEADTMGSAKEASGALKWEVTAAHLMGVSPYRDHFLRTARILQAGLGKRAADPFMGILWGWANAMVPLATMVLLLLALLGVVLSVRKTPGNVVAALAMAIPTSVVALWLGAGSGIKPYYGFKVATLCAGLVMVAAVVGMHRLSDLAGPRVARGLMLLLLVSRAPAWMAVELEYARGLALDASFTRMVDVTLQATRNRPSHATDASPTRRFWESRFLLARAREKDNVDDADVVFCRDCVLDGRLVQRSGPYALWVRR